MNVGYQRQDFGFDLRGLTESGATRPIHDVFHYFGAGVSVMLPVRNRNQGNVAAARAESRAMDRRRELAELTARYFTSHGPATAQDYAWWSGLTVADARAGIAMVTPSLLHAVVDGTTYWFAKSSGDDGLDTPVVRLLPNFDEHLVAYRDRSATFDAAHLLWYAGALIVISAMGLFSTLAFSQLGGRALTACAIAYAVAFTLAGHHLWYRNRTILMLLTNQR